MCKRPGARHKFSTKLPTIWSHVLDGRAEVQINLLFPCKYCTHSFIPRAGKSPCPAVCWLLADWIIPPAIGAKRRPLMHSPLACCVTLLSVKDPLRFLYLMAGWIPQPTKVDSISSWALRRPMTGWIPQPAKVGKGPRNQMQIDVTFGG